MGREQPRNVPKPLKASEIPHKCRVRFWESVDCSTPAGCWAWMGYRDSKGYGQFKATGRARWAHRVAYALKRGDIPEGMSVDHTCRNPSCCNPSHLELATVHENATKGNLDRHADRRATPELPV